MTKKRILLTSIIVTAMLMLCSACSVEKPADNVKTEITQQTSELQKIQDSEEASSTQTVTEESVYEDEVSKIEPSVYDSTLQSIYDAIISADEEKLLDIEGMTGLAESARYTTVNSTLNDSGYAVKDINEDGIPELIIASVNERSDDKCYGSTLYSLFTFADEKVVCLLDGYARNRYDLFEDGTVYNNGSGGAIYYVSTTYKLPPNGNSLKCIECYFTHEKNEDFENIAVYHNTTGSWDISESEETDMTIDDFFEYTEKLGKQAVSLELIPFSQYKNAKPLDLFDSAKEKITDDTVCAAAFLGYHEGSYDEFVQYLRKEGYLYKYPFLAEIDIDRIILDEGGEWYLLLPVKEDSAIKINQAEMDEINFTIKEGKELYQGSGSKPLLLRGNVSEIVPGFIVTISEADGNSCVYSPALSMMDGSLQSAEGIADITDYEYTGGIYYGK